MFQTIAEFTRAWQAESANTQKIMSALTDASLAQKVSPEGRSLGRLAWHVVQTLGEMGGHAGLKVEAANEKTPQPAIARPTSPTPTAPGLQPSTLPCDPPGPTRSGRRDRHVRREMDARDVAPGPHVARNPPPGTDDGPDATGRPESAGRLRPVPRGVDEPTACRPRTRTCGVPASVVCRNAARASLLALTGAAVALGRCRPCAATCIVPSRDASPGRSSRVLDGDSLKVLRDGAEVEVRLLGVDAPEGGQAFGNVSKRALSNLVFGRTVHVAVRDIDHYGRSVARVTADGRTSGSSWCEAGSRGTTRDTSTMPPTPPPSGKRGLRGAACGRILRRLRHGTTRRRAAEHPAQVTSADPCYTDIRSALSPAADGTPRGLPLPSTSKLRAV